MVLLTEQDVEQFQAVYPLERLTRLKLSFCAEHNQASNGLVPRLSAAAAERVIRSDRLARLTELVLRFHHLPEVQARLAEVLADPSVLPRLVRLSFFGSYGNERPSLDGLRARFGPRLIA